MVGARKRRMDPTKLTFLGLIELMTQEVTAGKATAASFPNLRSALTSFCAQQKVALQSPVGSVLRSTYYARIREHRAALLAEDRTDSYITNRCSLLARWRRLVTEYDRQCAVQHGAASPFQLAVLDAVAKFPHRKGVALAIGMSPATMARWTEGAAPSTRSLQYVPRLERYAGLVPGTLSDLLPRKLPEQFERGGDSSIDYRKRLAVASQDPYALKDPPGLLRTQWAALVAFKVNREDDFTESQPVLDDDDDESGDGRVILSRSANSLWRVRPAETVGGKIPWFAEYNGLYVPTAEVNWSFISQFYGWLGLDRARGGMGQTREEACRLSNLARRSLLDGYFRWRLTRTDGVVNSGFKTFAVQIAGLCNPNTGYLTQSYLTVGSDSGLDEQAWQTRCSKCYRYLRNKVRAWEQPGVMKVSRDPFEPIAAALELENPMMAIRDMVNRMVASRPTGRGTKEAVWARNILMVKLLASNALRELNLRTLTIASEEGEGQLRRDPDGSWRIFISKDELKNVRGAAKDKDYDRLVRREIWPDIERYINYYRPMLLKSSSNRLFISERTGGPVSRKMLARCFERLTRMFLPNCPGIGPHYMRHIVACAHVKSKPDGIAVAAAALHDMVKTVEKHYARFGRKDVSRWESDVLDGPFSGMN
jgi:hypothetical protein